LRGCIAEIDKLYPVGRQTTDPKQMTRSREFAPEWPSPAPLTFDIVREVKIGMVSTVCRKRSAAVTRVKSNPSVTGKLLVYEVDGTVWCGGSEAVSKGYFDLADEPGWNTWIDYYEDSDLGPRLLCYVPQPLVEFAYDGIAANPVACIYWIECPELIPPNEGVS
jgi:hypothetical protein